MTSARGRPELPLSDARGKSSLWVGALPALGLACALALMTLAAVIPAVTDWNVFTYLPPLRAGWRPRIGPGTFAALAIALLGFTWATRTAASIRWSALLVGTWAVSVAWVVSLGSVDGLDSFSHFMSRSAQYLDTGRAPTDVSVVIQEYISRIPLRADNHFPVHLSGHPPGVFVFYAFLAQLGVGAPVAAGLVTTLIATTTPAAVLVTLRVLGAEVMARKAAPFLVLCPAAIWWPMLADGLFAAAAAWGLAALAQAACRRSIGWSLTAGVLLGYCVMLSYGLVLLGFLALGVLIAARSTFPLLWAVAAAMAVVIVFAVEGFAWWEAYPVLRERYWDGVARLRPTSYWLWADLAALGFSAGPIMFAGVAQTLGRSRTYLAERATRAVVVLVAAAVTTVAIADLSLMSKAEVERIWLPFMPWLLIGCALLPPRWARFGLAVQLGTALLISNLVSIPH